MEKSNSTSPPLIIPETPGVTLKLTFAARADPLKPASSVVNTSVSTRIADICFLKTFFLLVIKRILLNLIYRTFYSNRIEKSNREAAVNKADNEETLFILPAAAANEKSRSINARPLSTRHLPFYGI